MSKPKNKRRCRICGGSMAGRSTSSRICGSDDCVRERNRRKAALWGIANLWGRPKKCVKCKRTFKRSRWRKKFCSDRCAGTDKASRSMEAKP